MTKDLRILSLLWLNLTDWQLMTAFQMPAAHLPLCFSPQAVVCGGGPGPASYSNTPPVLLSLFMRHVAIVKQPALRTPPCNQILRNIVAKFHISSALLRCTNTMMGRRWAHPFSTLLSSYSVIGTSTGAKESSSISSLITFKCAHCHLKKDLWTYTLVIQPVFLHGFALN